MDKTGFQQYLNIKKYSPRRIPVYIAIIEEFDKFLKEKKNINDLHQISLKLLDEFINQQELLIHGTPIIYYRTLRRYYQFKEDKSNLSLLSIFKIKDHAPKSQHKTLSSNRKSVSRRLTYSSIPQVLNIVTIGKGNKISLNKLTREYLNLLLDQLVIVEDTEVLLWTEEEFSNSSYKGLKTAIHITLTGGKIVIPESILGKLNLEQKDPIAFITRENSLALKKVDIQEKSSDTFYPYIIDRENETTLVREIYRISSLDLMLKKLRKTHQNPRFTYDYLDYVKKHDSYACWVAQQLLGIPYANNYDLGEALINERLEKQLEDGSWETFPKTTRVLRELYDLKKENPDTEFKESVEKGIKWLLNRAESEYNPGMFFLEDNLVEIQKEIVDKRKNHTKGTRTRFRDRKSKYERMIAEADGVSKGACGPQIMWSNALALDVLLKWGYEDHKRVQRIYNTMTLNPRWCECGYQHGLSDWKRLKITDEIKTKGKKEVLKNLLERAEVRALNAGTYQLKDVLNWHLSNTRFKKIKRIKVLDETSERSYLIRHLRQVEGCGLYTAKYLIHSTDPSMKMLAQMYLWMCFSMQEENGGFSQIDRAFDSFTFLSIVAEWDGPVAHTIILRAIPWLIEHQNEDGSWGDEEKKDCTTLIVIRALLNAGVILMPTCIV